MKGHEHSITVVKLCASGRPKSLLVSASLDATIKVEGRKSSFFVSWYLKHQLWNIQPSGCSCLATLRGHSKGISSLDCSAGNRLVSSDYGGNINLWDCTTPAHPAGPLFSLAVGSKQITQVSFNEMDICASSLSGNFYIWDCCSGRLKLSLPCHSPVGSFRVADSLLVLGQQNSIVLMDLRTGKKISTIGFQELSGHSLVNSICLDTEILSCSLVSSSSIFCWRSSSTVGPEKWRGHSLSVRCLKEDCTKIFSGGADACVRVSDGIAC